MSANCDFCNAVTGPGKRTFRAKNQIILTGPGCNWVDQGDWTACETCADLIERQEWKALMERAKNLNPGIRAAIPERKKLEDLLGFIAATWGGIFDQRPEAFL
jgi:hypothetical protein